MSLSARYAALGVIALLALQWIWHALLLPPSELPRWLPATLYSLPLLPSLALLAGRRQSAGFWGAVAALFYFCHGIAEAWTLAQARPLALAEIALAVWVIVASSWPGLKARRARKKPPANV